MGMNLGPEYPELLADLALQLREFLIEQGIPDDKADAFAREAAERVRQNYGGQLIYVPTGLGHEVLQRWQEIWTKFTGDNIAALAKEYRMTEIHIYRIIRRMREVERRKLQHPLFPETEK